MKTVRNAYNITEDDLYVLDELAENQCGGDDCYWKRARKFIHDVLDKDSSEMTNMQKVWAESILERIQK